MGCVAAPPQDLWVAFDGEGNILSTHRDVHSLEAALTASGVRATLCNYRLRAVYD